MVHILSTKNEPVVHTRVERTVRNASLPSLPASNYQSTSKDNLNKDLTNVTKQSMQDYSSIKVKPLAKAAREVKKSTKSSSIIHLEGLNSSQGSDVANSKPNFMIQISDLEPVVVAELAATDRKESVIQIRNRN